MSEQIFSTEIILADQKATLACDAQCRYAWGTLLRPRIENSLKEDDFEWMADLELGEAPEMTGVIEGGDDKPRDLLDAHNRWCARQCERAEIFRPGEKIVLLDFSKRVPRVPKA